MTSILVTNRAGKLLNLPAEEGQSVMETIRDNGLDDLLALCGGGCSCATCHVYVDEAFLEQLPTLAGDEDELLNGSNHRRPNSRLCCQIRMVPSLDGLRVTIAPEE